MKSWKLAGWALSLAMAATPLHGMAQQGGAPILEPKATLIVTCDLACNWRLAGESGRIEAGSSAKIKVKPGLYVITATTLDGLDETTYKIAVKAAGQNTTRVALLPKRDARLKAEQQARDKAQQEAADRAVRDQLARDKAAQDAKDRAARNQQARDKAARDKAEKDAKDKTAQEAAARLQPRTLEGHTGLVHSVAFSPDSRTLASGGMDHTIKLWNVTSGQVVMNLQGHAGAIWSVAFSPDGHTLASGSWDKTIKLWDVASGQLLRTLQGHADYVLTVAFSPDGRTLASGSRDKSIKLWDVASGQLLRTLQGHANGVTSVAFSPDGRTLASASADKTIKLWDAASGQFVRTLQGHTAFVYSVAFTPDGKTLASGGEDLSIKLWDAASGQLLRTLPSTGGYVYSIAVSPDSHNLVSGTSDYDTVKLWNLSSGQLLRKMNGYGGNINSVAYSPDGRTVASGGDDHTIKLWDVTDLRQPTDNAEHVTTDTTPIQPVAITPHPRPESFFGYSVPGTGRMVRVDDSSLTKVVRAFVRVSLKSRMQAKDTDTDESHPNQVLRLSTVTTEEPLAQCRYLAKVVTLTYWFEDLAPVTPQSSTQPAASVARGEECITTDADDAERKAAAKAVSNLRIGN
jgi:tricorn protease-like protein